MFSEKTIEAIGYYVYCLVDPRNNEVFYIGKGRGNRVFNHIKDALGGEENIESEKLDLIREIIDQGLEVSHYIIRYGLEEAVALEVEAALIDCLGIENLTNAVKGHHVERGKISCEELEIKMGAQEVIIGHDVLIIKINQLYRRGMTQEELYEVTRKYWKLSERNAKSITYVFAVVNGIIRGVFEPERWYQDTRPGSVDKPKRIAFTGKVAPKEICEQYLGKTVSHYSKTQGQNPTVYIFGAPTHTEKERESLEEIVSKEERKLGNIIEKEVEEITEIDEKVLAIKVNKEYREGMSSEELYRITSYCWHISLEKAKKVDYVFAIAQGEIKEVYTNLEWYIVEERGRIAFTGQVANEEMRKKYIGKSMKKLYTQGEANPCKYFIN